MIERAIKYTHEYYPVEVRIAFIKSYLEQNGSAHIHDKLFHDSYHGRFPNYSFKQSETSDYIQQAMSDLARMELMGIVLRRKANVDENPKGKCFVYHIKN